MTIRTCLVSGVFLAALALVSCGGGGVDTTQPPAAMLAEAWRLYNFTEFKNAAKLFQAVQRHSAATAEEKLQARIGSIFVVQYQQPGRNPKAALGQYEELLAELPRDHAQRPLVLSRMADCCMELDTPDPVKARGYLKQVIAAAPAKSVLQQDAILQLALTYVRGKPSDDDLKQALAVLAEHEELMKGGRLAGSAHNLAAEVALMLGDHARAEAELEKWVDAGIQNFTFRARVYFRIARLNEIELNNPEKAARYYRKLADEEPSDRCSYFARKRAMEIENGHYRDGDLALPPDRFRKAAAMGKSQ